ncbi:MAG: 4-alpha-glucanotransferase [Halioglobus sp.]
MDNLEKLLYLRGVAAEYFDYSGNRVVVSHEVRLKFLEEVGYNVADDQAIQQAIFELDALPWQSWLKSFNTLSLGESEYLEIRVHPDEKSVPFEWQVITETGVVTRGQLIPGELPEVGEYYIDGVRYSAHRKALMGLPMGYHQIVLSSRGRQVQAELVVVPKRCFEFEGAGADRLWGINCQLYTLRSGRNWGIGDFSDLRELIECCAAAGMDLVGLNPLHAPQLAGADFASPYSPSDRRFLNPLYIDPERVRDFRESEAIGEQLSGSTHREKLVALRALPLVDYDGVASLKYAVFEAMFQHFRQHHLQSDTDRATDFHRFVRQHGEPLQAFAEHEAAHSGPRIPGAREALFHQYLQWIAQEQLQECQTLALSSGMKIGLMGDLAVGAVRAGAEVESKPALFCARATVGAPPDPFSRDGQNWNLPALDPVALRRDNYGHFIDLLRANMSYCGALRIDHVMGLMRLWWCLPDLAGGAYVYYPLQDLLAILRLESHRNQCVVIGEDMGVVPDDLRAKMAETAVYSNKVFYFERTQEQQFKHPRDHQVDALLMVTNHDVSTLAGWWDGTDLHLRGDIGLLDIELELPEALRQRQEERISLLNWLQSLQLLPASWAGGNVDAVEGKPFDIALCGAILAASARSRSRMMSFQLDDLQLLQEPVNIPGTYREYPNWRRKQRLATEALFGDSQIQALLASTYQERKQ